MSGSCHEETHALQQNASLCVGSNRRYPQKASSVREKPYNPSQGAELLFQSGHFSGRVRNDCHIVGQEKTTMLKVASRRTDSIHIVISILVPLH